MIKFLHFADLHLGIENYGRLDSKTGLSSRFLDFLKNFDYACHYALNNKIDLVLFAGDAYKTKDPSPTHQREFAKRIKKLASYIPVVLLVGNHDLPTTFGRANTLDIYSTLEVENVYVSREPEILKLKISAYGGSAEGGKNGKLKNDNVIQIATLPWISKNVLANEEDYKTRGIEETYLKMGQRLKDVVCDLVSKLDPNLPTVILAHTTLAGGEYGSEHKVFMGRDIVLPLDLFTKNSFDYVALGHLHKYQVLNENPPVVYSGSIDRVDFSEEREEKGFVVVDIDNKNTKYQFIPVPARKFLTISVTLKEDDRKPTQKVIDSIEKQDIKGVVTRVNIKIPESQVENLQENEIRKSLDSAHFVAGINKEIIKTVRAKEQLSYTEELSVIEALEKYWQSKDVSEKRVKKLKEQAEKLID